MLEMSLVVSNRHDVGPHAVADAARSPVTVSTVVALVVPPEILHYGVPGARHVVYKTK